MMMVFIIVTVEVVMFVFVGMTVVTMMMLVFIGVAIVAVMMFMLVGVTIVAMVMLMLIGMAVITVMMLMFGFVRFVRRIVGHCGQAHAQDEQDCNPFEFRHTRDSHKVGFVDSRCSFSTAMDELSALIHWERDAAIVATMAATAREERGMKDFRRPRQSMTIEEQRAGLIRRLVLIQAFGAPLFLGLALSAMAYFGSAVLVPALADPEVAFRVMLVCIAGFVVEVFLSFKTVLALNALKKQV